MGDLTRNDLSVIEGDARVSSRRLAEVLGFARVTDFHRLVRTHQDELEDLGGVLRFEARKSSPGRGRPALTYLLNEHQAVALCMWAETPAARAARRQIIEVFVAYRRGDAYELARLRQQPDPFQANAQRVGHVADHLQSLEALAAFEMQVTHLPIWKNGRRPQWWHDVEVRAFVIRSHRQMTLLACEREGTARFGARFPRKSSIGDFWLRLDRALGPMPRLRTPLAQVEEARG